MTDLQKKLASFNEEDLQRIYHNCFDSEAGQLVLEDLRNRCFFKLTPFGMDANETNRNVGMQSVVMHIETMLTEDKKESE